MGLGGGGYVRAHGHVRDHKDTFTYAQSSNATVRAWEVIVTESKNAKTPQTKKKRRTNLRVLTLFQK